MVPCEDQNQWLSVIITPPTSTSAGMLYFRARIQLTALLEMSHCPIHVGCGCQSSCRCCFCGTDVCFSAAFFFFSSSSVRKNKTWAMDTSMMTASFSLFLHAEDEARTYCTAMSSMSDDKQDDKLRLLPERVQNGWKKRYKNFTAHAQAWPVSLAHMGVYVCRCFAFTALL